MGIKDEVQEAVEKLANDLAEAEFSASDVADAIWSAPVGPHTTTTTTVDPNVQVTDNTVHVPHIYPSGAGSGQIYITDDNGTDFQLNGGWASNEATIGVGNLQIMVKENGEAVATLDGTEYHFSKQKVKGFLEKFADAIID